MIHHAISDSVYRQLNICEEQTKRLEASNAELLAALALAQVSALKLAHMVFVCSAYAGRAGDIRAEVDRLRVLTTAAIADATP